MCCIEISDSKPRKWKPGEEAAWEARRANLPTATEAQWTVDPRTGYLAQEYRTVNGVKKVLDFSGPRRPHPAVIHNERRPTGRHGGTVIQGPGRLPGNDVYLGLQGTPQGPQDLPQGPQVLPQGPAGTDYGTRREPGTRAQASRGETTRRGAQTARRGQQNRGVEPEDEVPHLAFDVGSEHGTQQSTRNRRAGSTRRNAAPAPVIDTIGSQRLGSTRHARRPGH